MSDDLVKRLRDYEEFEQNWAGQIMCQKSEIAEEAADRIEALEAKLAKAAEVLTRLLATAHADDHDGWQDALKDARALLAEIEGEKT